MGGDFREGMDTRSGEALSAKEPLLPIVSGSNPQSQPGHRLLPKPCLSLGPFGGSRQDAADALQELKLPPEADVT